MSKYTVNLWGSHPDEDNDDCWTGSDFDTLEEARLGFDDPEKYGRDRELKGWIKTVCDETVYETVYIELSGPDVYEVRVFRSKSSSSTKSNSARGEDDDWRREQAIELGMCLGIDAYNDAMGW